MTFAAPFEVTEAMISAGIEVYLGNPPHDEMCFDSPADIVRKILTVALVARDDAVL